jgi:hypothetical protein
MTGFLRLFNCALLLMLTCAATIWLRITIEPYLPSGEWHGMLTGLFLCVHVAGTGLVAAFAGPRQSGRSMFHAVVVVGEELQSSSSWASTAR